MRKGQKHTLESRKKLSLSHLGLHPIGGFLGKKHSAETIQKMRQSQKKRVLEGRHNLWKGNQVGYRALHAWLERVLGKANHCEECGLDKIPEGKKRYFQWANISGRYKRNLVDWLQLCIKCHLEFDNNFIGTR